MVSHAPSRHTGRSSSKDTTLFPRHPIFDNFSAIPTTITNHTTDLDIPRRLMYNTPQFTYTPTEAGQTAGFDFDLPNESNYQFDSNFPSEWGMQFSGNDNNSVGGGLGAIFTNNQKQFRSSGGHSRNASESTINSAGPSSPFTSSSFSNPYIANSEQSPRSRSSFDEKHSGPNAQYQHYSNVGYTPSQLSHTPLVHLDMKHMVMDQHNASADEIPDFSHSSRQSVSSRGQDSPSTPQMEKGTIQNDDIEAETERPGLYKINTNDYRSVAPRVELFRTESAAAADELYNPEFSQPSAPSTSHLQAKKQTNANSDYLSPNRNLVQDRIRTANSARSQSPQQATARDKSPFRPGSPLAPTDGMSADGFKSPSAFFTSAADARRQQIEEASAREMNRHKKPTLQREPTKTMSPCDALLDYNVDDVDANSEMPLFPEAIPVGYERNTGPAQYYTNNFINGGSQPFGTTTQPAQQMNNMGAFRPQTVTQASPNNFNFMQPQQQQQQQHQQQQQQQPQQAVNPYTGPQYRQHNYSEQAPDFPAHLTSMESSVSDAPISSQNSTASEVIQRPHDTSAATGGYTCTSQGCTQRFDSPAKLQKHKRDIHRTQRDGSASLSLSSVPPTTAPASANLSVSPDPSHDGSEGSVGSVGSGMTSAALQARNSQAGPHKCTRINPSTGKPCNTIFSRPYDLTRHEDTIHNRQKVKVRCQYCREEKTFSRNDALTRHMRVVHPDVQWEVKRGGRGGRSDY